MINKKALQAQMVLFGDTQEALATGIGITRVSLSKKINGSREFLLNEVDAIRKRYNLSLEAVASIFFTE